MKRIKNFCLTIFTAIFLWGSALPSGALAAPAAPAAPAATGKGFSEEKIPETVLSRMRGKSYPDGCVLPLEDLRYLQVLHYGFDGKVQRGEIIVNKIVAQDVLSIFKELYEAKYPIEKMRLIDDYNAQDDASMTDNNSSAFCFRNISNTNRISNHGKGLAIDINPLYNPHVKNELVSPKGGTPHAYTRASGNPYYIADNDLCVRTFAKYGFTWGGDFTLTKDYQHFERKIDGLYTDLKSTQP